MQELEHSETLQESFALSPITYGSPNRYVVPIVAFLKLLCFW